MATQYEYKFVSEKLKGGWLTGRPKPEYRETIIEQAQDGWRFVQAFAPPVGGVGEADYVDLIFERACEDY